MRRASAALALLLAAAAPGALAYNETVHHFLTRRALAGRDGWLDAQLVAPTPADHAAFRARFWKLASQVPDAALRARFLQEFPTEASLDAWSFKEFLMLDPAATVHGLDVTRDDVTETRGVLLPQASRWPDDDERNRHRYERDEKHSVMHDANGLPIPFDPATLELGGLSGTSSQGHAHYGLLPGPHSDDPEVLKKDPRHFAIPPTVHSFGVEFAQLYADLALLASQAELPSSPWLEASFAGASFHHVEDVANQIHTIQVGIYDFFEAAFIQSKLRDVRTLGGLLGERRSLQQLGLRLVANHHLLLEDLFAKRVEEAERGKPEAPEVTAAIAGLDQDDDAFAAPARAAMAAARAKGEGEIAALMRVLIDQSSLEGPDCYRLIWEISKPTLHDGAGYEYDGAGDDNPDKFVDTRSAKSKEILSRFYALEGKGLRRGATALRLWEASAEADAKSEGASARALDRTLRLLLGYHQDASARRAAWVPPAAKSAEPIAWGYPIGALVLLALLVLLVRRLRRRSR